MKTWRRVMSADVAGEKNAKDEVQLWPGLAENATQ